MELRFSPLFSGSSGNATYVGCDDAHILVDAGMSGNRVTGDAQHRLCAFAAKNCRLAGLHGNAVIQHLAHFTDHTGREILATGR